MLTVSQDNRFTAYDNLHKALLLDPKPYQDDEALRDIVAELGTGLSGLDELRKEKARPNKGPAKEKKAAKQFLADVAAEIAGDLFEWATKHQNPTLQAAADYSASELFVLRGTRLYDVTGLILELGREQQAAMGKYAISAARLQELEDARTAFDGLRSGPRQQRAGRKAVGLTIGQRFSALATLVVDRFGRAIRKYKRLDRAFYDRVMAAREVIDNPGTHDAPTPPPAA